MYHPQPDGIYEFEADLERLIAEEANDILNAHCVFKGSYDETTGTSSSEISTERYDIQQADGSYESLRLRMMHQVNANSNGVADPAIPEHDACIGLLLEYANFDDDALQQYGVMLDDAVTWQPYIFIGVEATDKQAQACVLNAKNGAVLTMQDKMDSLRVLRALRSHLASVRLDSDVYETLYPETYGAADPKPSTLTDGIYEEFDPGKFLVGYSCNICEKPYSLCQHQTAWQN
jgi:hypothetical protein